MIFGIKGLMMTPYFYVVFDFPICLSFVFYYCKKTSMSIMAHLSLRLDW